MLARDKDPVVRIVPMVQKAKPQRRFGALKGKIRIGPEFFEPPAEET